MAHAQLSGDRIARLDGREAVHKLGHVDGVEELARNEVAELQLLGAGFRPVFLLDVPTFNRARSYGYVVELVTPRTAWSEDLPDWSEYVAARVASMTAFYGVSAVITVGPRGLGDVARGVLRSFG